MQAGFHPINDHFIVQSGWESGEKVVEIFFEGLQKSVKGAVVDVVVFLDWGDKGVEEEGVVGLEEGDEN